MCNLIFLGYHLLKGIDQVKDQTFFLAQIPKHALEKCIFPLGGMTKKEVKQIAAECGFDRIVQKKEVTQCFKYLVLQFLINFEVLNFGVESAVCIDLLFFR